MRRFILFFVGMVLSNWIWGGTGTIGLERVRSKDFIAVVVDSCTFSRVERTLGEYKGVLEGEGFRVFDRVVGEGVSPEEIRKGLVKLYVDYGIEGVIFIGNVPVPMIKGAQHLTGAFKMDEKKYGLRRSSVPSDCYYTDFDLQFSFVGRDSIQPELFYYELSAESPQIVEKEIYSGRIKPFYTGEEFYRGIERYLQKVIAVKKSRPGIDSIMVFTGHGYHSESLASWANEYMMLREQFPGLFGCPGGVCFLYHNMFPGMKKGILRYLGMRGTDIAIFHAHGGRDAQYLFSFPEGGGLKSRVNYIRRFLRSKLRSARRRGRSIEDVKKYYMNMYGVPESWFEGAFDDSVMREDSIFSATLDVYVEDLKLITPEPKLMILDQCFTGDFTSSKYIAGEYLFGNGKAIVVIANSVNVRQDIWANEYLGLLRYGVRVGLIHKMNSCIESHILGDPTFAFLGGERVLDISHERGVRYWKKLLRSEDVPLRVLSLRKVFDLMGERAARLLVDVYKGDNSFNVRLEALKLLAKLRSEEFENILRVSIRDQNEMIRRFSAMWMGKIGDTKFARALIERAVYDNSSRVRWVALRSLEVMPYERVVAELGKVDILEEDRKRLESVLERNFRWLRDELLPVMSDIEKPVRERVIAIRTFRNYNFVEAVEPLLRVSTDRNESVDVRVCAIETLGWYQYSRERGRIVEELKACLEGSHSEMVRKELLKTVNRLEGGPNDPLSP